MSAVQEQEAPSAVATTTETLGLLDQVIGATKHTERDRAQELVSALTEQALEGTLTFDKSVSKSIAAAIESIDKAISKQLASVMHAEEFQKLEGSWRGLNYLTSKSETSAMLKIKMFNASKDELFKDLDRAVEFDQSQTFKKLYENEFGTPGGEPYGVLIGDYEFTNHPQDVDLLEKMSNVAAASFCPFITSPSPKLFGFASWTELSQPRDLEKIFESVEYAKWKSFRDSEDSRFVAMTMPRALARLPYGAQTCPVEDFGYEETTLRADGKQAAVDHREFCWMNAAYVLGERLTHAFSTTNWCTAIRGAEGGGKVEGLPTYTFTSDDGDPDMQCPTEVGITDRREAELSKLGFISLSHYKNTDYAVFFGGQTVQKPKKYDRPEASANAEISARLPYIMATSRLSHYLKVIARDKIGSFMEATDVQNWLDRWLHNYVSADPNPSEDAKARFPLREAKVQVQEVPGKPGSYQAIAWLRPWLQMEELTSSMRMVARIPKLGS